MLDFWRKLRSRSPTKSANSGANKIKRLGAIIIRKSGDLRFNNYPEALIFGSFHQGKEQKYHFKRDFHLFPSPKKVEPKTLALK
jgi:hypothetical protein